MRSLHSTYGTASAADLKTAYAGWSERSQMNRIPIRIPALYISQIWPTNSILVRGNLFHLRPSPMYLSIKIVGLAPYCKILCYFAEHNTFVDWKGRIHTLVLSTTEFAGYLCDYLALYSQYGLVGHATGRRYFINKLTHHFLYRVW